MHSPLFIHGLSFLISFSYISHNILLFSYPIYWFFCPPLSAKLAVSVWMYCMSTRMLVHFNGPLRDNCLLYPLVITLSSHLHINSNFISITFLNARNAFTQTRPWPCVNTCMLWSCRCANPLSPKPVPTSYKFNRLLSNIAEEGATQTKLCYEHFLNSKRRSNWALHKSLFGKLNPG